MPLFVVKEDITKMNVDAIVNPANPTLLGGGGLDGEIHSAAGPKLLKKCRTLGGCATGEAKITKGYNLPAKYIIHTVGPIWQGGNCGEKELLHRCYLNSLALAVSKRCSTVAIPVISAGAYGYPYDSAVETAKLSILEFLNCHDGISVYLVMRERRSPEKSRLYSQIEYYMMQNGISSTNEIPDRIFSVCTENLSENEVRPIAEQTPTEFPCQSPTVLSQTLPLSSAQPEDTTLQNSEKCTCDKGKGTFQAASPYTEQSRMSAPTIASDIRVEKAEAASKKIAPAKTISDRQKKQQIQYSVAPNGGLEDMLKNLDKSFSETLLHLIDDSGMTDSECYKRANIDRKLFSKIRKDKNYKPSKPTVLAFAIALRLDLNDTRMLLERAGFALSPSSKFDMIIQYFITRGIYDIFEINDALFAFDQNLLGA